MQITPAERRKLVDVLLLCATISDYQKRRTLIADLDSPIPSQIDDNPAAKFHVTELVKTCANHGRIAHLLEVLTYYEEGSFAMDEVQRTWDEMVAQRQPKVVVSPVIQRPKIEFDWVTIPAGRFLMGSNDVENEKEPHTIHLPEYQIARVPTTNEQWVAFLRDSGYVWKGLADWWQWIHQDKYDEKIHVASKISSLVIPPGKEKHPVVYVTWHDCVAFCEWATQQLTVGEAAGARCIRLPTEAEWEKAARGTDKYKYPWGNNEPTTNLCNFNRNIDYTTVVGAYPEGASPYGVLDMAGNVWEWTLSDYRPYPYQADDGRDDLILSNTKVVSGGSWRDDEDYLRCAFRGYYLPNYGNHFFGFRCFCVSV